MDIKKILRVILIFLVIYIIFGIGHTFFTGDHNFFKEFSINKGDAMFVAFLWPLFFPIIAGSMGIAGLIVGSLLSIGLVWFFVWMSNLIDKKLFAK